MTTVLVNKNNPLSENYIPSDLVITDNNENNFHNYVDPNQKPSVVSEVFYMFNKLHEEALKEGYNIIIDSGYRSYEYQKMVWDDMVKRKGFDYTLKYVALPGTSEHQTGLAIDIAVIKNNKYDDNINEEYDEYKWMINNSYKYGFILRYPNHKEEITGYNFEPWHYRYVGIDLATILYEENITLEEYYLKKENTLLLTK